SNRSSIGRVLQSGCDRGGCRWSPTQIAVTVATWKLETPLVELAHYLGNRAQLQECLKQQLEPFLHLHVGVLDDHARGVADKADRQVERKLTPLRFRKKARRQSTTDRMEFELRYRPFHTDQKSTARASRTIGKIT